MTQNEALDLGVLAMELLPRTTAGQAKLFVESILPLHRDQAEKALREHARTNEHDPNRLCIPGFKAAMDDLAKGTMLRGREKWQREQAEAIERERREKREKADTDKSVRAARSFCESHPHRLDEWRAQIVAEMPHLGRLTQGKPTLQSTALVCAIYSKFGRVPVECGL